jgi:uncharacterized RDD family membrane protein YckC
MENRVGFGPRLLALLIDYAGIYMLAIIVYLIAPLLMQTFVDAALAEMSEEQLSQIPFDITPIISFVYLVMFARAFYFVSEIALGTSLGKYLLKLKITTTDGQAPSMGKLAARYLVKHIYPLVSIISMILAISWLGTIGSLLGLVVFAGCFAATGDKKQTIQDMVAQTIVISTKAPKAIDTTSAWISEGETAK